jgi:hypothetical protein
MILAQRNSIGRVIVAAVGKRDHVGCIDEGNLAIRYPNT